ncbi:acyltransferase family protein [Knoellia sp. S7-12]|uniref:DUF459 domain-containing protein n=1 Tax=Knoellia sp. S7-12 TaxID=3126698 RepID=UPI0033678C5F
MRAELPHRPALDGVRAIAVLLVLLYHGGVRSLPGGFLGVDVFFVLSGFLITSLLLVEWSTTDRIDVAAFWFRRARRLLPALVLVLIVVAAYAAWMAPDITRERLRGDMLSALFYVANWRFVVNGVSYFEQYATPTPLLHTWSLAIEEQFYLVWPIVVFVLARYLAKGSKEKAPLVIGAVCAGAAVVSAGLMFAMYEPGLDPSRVYYGTDTRAQALLVGAAAAGLAVSRGWWTDRGGSGGRLAAALGVVGLLGVGAFGAFGSDSAPWMYRGGFLVAALAAAALVVAVAHPSVNPVTSLLSVGPLRWIGLASYGIYLWHWVIFVILTPERTGAEGKPLLAIRIALTLLVSTMSYVWVEKPVREWRPRRGESVWSRRVVSAVGAALAFSLAVTVLSTGARAARPELSSDNLVGPAPQSSDVAPTGPTLPVFLLGDSVAWNMHHDNPPDPALGLDVSGSTKLGCGQFPGGLVVFGQKEPVNPVCRDWPAEWRETVQRLKPKISVMMPGNLELFDHHDSNRNDYAFGTPEYRDALLEWMETTTNDLGETSQAVAITTIPCYDKPNTGLDENYRVVNDVTRQDWLNGVIRNFARTHPEVHLMDLRSAVCPDGRYEEVVGGVKLRVDGVHWSPAGSQWVWRWMAGQLRTIEEQLKPM